MSAADVVVDAFDKQHLIDLLTAANPTLDEDGAYAIAREVHDRRVARGERPVGRKIGFTNRKIWELYGVSTPIWSHVYESNLHTFPDGNARLAIAHLLQPRLEPEIQLHFSRTPPVTGDEDAILDCVDWIADGFEIVQCPFAGWQFTAPDTIAAYGLHHALVVGPPIPVAGIDDCAAKLRSFTIALTRNGEEVATGSGADVLDSPLLAFAELASALATQSRFEPVQAGEVITTGTLTPAFPIEAGETWATTLDGIDVPGMTITFS